MKEKDKYVKQIDQGGELESPFYSDIQFDRLYPAKIQQLSSRHWTPLHIAKKAARFLAAESGVRILDIGSGIGKFCLSAAPLRPRAFFYGVEQRSYLVYNADKIRSLLGIQNVSFRHCNFTQLDFRDYDHFYFYNSFYENLVGTDKIDHSIYYSEGLYQYYNRYLYQQLEKMPTGTKLATFHSLEEEVPRSYQVVHMEGNTQLKFWMKV